MIEAFPSITKKKENIILFLIFFLLNLKVNLYFDYKAVQCECEKANKADTWNPLILDKLLAYKCSTDHFTQLTNFFHNT